MFKKYVVDLLKKRIISVNLTFYIVMDNNARFMHVVKFKDFSCIKESKKLNKKSYNKIKLLFQLFCGICMRYNNK